MSNYSPRPPHYSGLKWLQTPLPTTIEPWLEGKKWSLRQRSSSHKKAQQQLQQQLERYPWRWPTHPIHFITDLHADAEALSASLVASGRVKRLGSRATDIKLKKGVRDDEFLIGGDCFDKGPSNLQLLRTLKKLKSQGARLAILAGNHDIRVLLGMRYATNRENPGHEHLFIRMGTKVIPLLSELERYYLRYPHALRDTPSNRRCRRELFPSPQWFKQFPAYAKATLTTKTIAKELERIEEKMATFEQQLQQADLTLRQVYAAILIWRKLFCSKKGSSTGSITPCD